MGGWKYNRVMHKSVWIQWSKNLEIQEWVYTIIQVQWTRDLNTSKWTLLLDPNLEPSVMIGFGNHK